MVFTEQAKALTHLDRKGWDLCADQRGASSSSGYVYQDARMRTNKEEMREREVEVEMRKWGEMVVLEREVEEKKRKKKGNWLGGNKKLQPCTDQTIEKLPSASCRAAIETSRKPSYCNKRRGRMP